MADARNETLTTSAVILCSYDQKRTSIAVYNNHASNILYLGFNPNVSASNGFPIGPKQGMAFSKETGDDPTLTVWGIASAAATDVRVMEQRV